MNPIGVPRRGQGGLVRLLLLPSTGTCVQHPDQERGEGVLNHDLTQGESAGRLDLPAPLSQRAEWVPLCQHVLGLQEGSLRLQLPSPVAASLCLAYKKAHCTCSCHHWQLPLLADAMWLLTFTTLVCGGDCLSLPCLSLKRRSGKHPASTTPHTRSGPQCVPLTVSERLEALLWAVTGLSC